MASPVQNRKNGWIGNLTNSSSNVLRSDARSVSFDVWHRVHPSQHLRVVPFLFSAIPVLWLRSRLILCCGCLRVHCRSALLVRCKNIKSCLSYIIIFESVIILLFLWSDCKTMYGVPTVLRSFPDNLPS